MISKKSIAAAAVLGVAFTGLIAVNPAAADPVSNSYVAVGSDTLQDVMNGLSNGTNVTGTSVRSLAGITTIGSFDAVGSASIQAKSNGVSFARPNGSGDGHVALSASIQGSAYKGTASIAGQVDIARSSSGPGTRANNNGPVVFIPFGRDALSYAYSGGNSALANLSQAQLTDIFNCTLTTVGGVAVTPVIPQAGSGSRSDWLSKLGLAATYDTAVPSCVKVGQEHDTSKLFDGSAFPTNAITPISVAQWVSQNTGAGASRIGSGVQIGSPTGVAPVTGSGVNTAPNKAFYDNTTWGRDTYVIVEYARIDEANAKYDRGLADLVDPSKAQSLTNVSTFPSTAGAVKQKYGFLAPLSSTPIRADFRN